MLARGRPAARSLGVPGMPSQGAAARERRQAKPLEQRQHSEQGVTGERRLQQKKQKRWQWDRYDPLERQERGSF